MPVKNTEAKDEMNLAEFPLCSLARRLPPDVKTLRFEDRIWDKSRNEWITRQLTISGSDAYGLPTKLDDEVLLGLIQLTRLQGFTDRKIPFTRHELIRMLGWRDDSKSYARIETSLNRWTGVTLYYNKAWWNKSRQCWMDEKFHILDNVWLCHRGDAPPDTGFAKRGAPASAFVWNEVIFRSFTHGNLKSIDFDFYKSLKSAVAKRLYRFLDKRFWHTHHHEFDLRELCCEHVGLARGYDAANLKRKLQTGIRELEERGFVRSQNFRDRFKKIHSGQWTITFEKPPILPTKEISCRGSESDTLAQMLTERGVKPTVASATAESFSLERIKRQIEAYDWLAQRNDIRVSRNPAGFLVASIKADYSMPKGFSKPSNNNHREGRIIRKPSCENTAPPENKNALRQEIAAQQFWQSLSGNELARCEQEALSSANRIERELLERGGRFASAARDAVLTAYALKKLATANH